MLRSLILWGLVILAVCSAVPLAQAAPAGWYIRLIAEVPKEQLKDPGNVLGQLPDAFHLWDSHDLEEHKPIGTPYLTLVFPHPDWDEQAGDYTSDFHALTPQPDQWKFEVRTDDPYRIVTLTWKGKKKWLQRSRLLDLKTGKVYRIKPGKHYRFSMGGEKQRAFVWGVKRR